MATTKKATAAKAKASTAPKAATAPEGAHVDLATPAEEAAMRKDATSPAARKAALAAGKKDPLEKWGPNNPNTGLETQRRAVFG
jgi:hypothetical protein